MYAIEVLDGVNLEKNYNFWKICSLKYDLSKFVLGYMYESFCDQRILSFELLVIEKSKATLPTKWSNCKHHCFFHKRVSKIK